MKAGAFFAAAAALPIGSLSDLTQGRGLLIVAPHPDDESLGCGGLIAEACQQGIDVRLLVVSDGVGSHPGSRRYPPPELRALREAETRHAASALALPSRAIRFLGLPDRHVPTRGEVADAACDAIVEAAEECHAGALCVTWCHDPHCDHVAAAELVSRARPRLTDLRIFSYPVWGWTLPPDVEVGRPPIGLRLPVGQHLKAKAAAIASHVSQTTALIDDDPTGFRLMPDVLEHFSGPFELFLEAPLVPEL